MTEEQIRYSKVIAEFMGENTLSDESIAIMSGNYVVGHKYIRYHTSYDWLMPVWVKFRDLRFSEVSDQMTHSAWKRRLANSIPYYEIGQIFDEISNAIEWYNSIKK